MYVGVLPVRMPVYHVSACVPSRTQEGADPPELELQMFVHCPVDAEN